MKLNKLKAFTLIEFIICLFIVSVFIYVASVSKTAYFQFIEKKEVESIVNSLTYSARVSVSTFSVSSIKILSNNKTLEIKYARDNSKKMIHLSDGLEFYICSKHKRGYEIFSSMAPSLGGVIHVIGRYKNYDIIFPVAIARFRLVVKDKKSPICE